MSSLAPQFFQTHHRQQDKRAVLDLALYRPDPALPEWKLVSYSAPVRAESKASAAKAFSELDEGPVAS